MRSALSFLALLLAALSAVFGVSSAYAAKNVGVTSCSSDYDCSYVGVDGNVYNWNNSATVTSGTAKTVLGLNGGYGSSWSADDAAPFSIDGGAMTGINFDKAVTTNDGILNYLTGTTLGYCNSYACYGSETEYNVLDFDHGYALHGAAVVYVDGTSNICPGSDNVGVWVSFDGTTNRYVCKKSNGSYVSNDPNYVAPPAGVKDIVSESNFWDSSAFVYVKSDDTLQGVNHVVPSGKWRDVRLYSQGMGCGVSMPSNLFKCWDSAGSVVKTSSVSVAASPSSGGSVQIDPTLLCVDNPSGSGSASFRSVVATGTGYEYDLSFSTVDESWTYPSERSLWLKGVDVTGHSDGPSLAAGGTGRFVVEKGSVFSVFDDPFVEVRSLSGSVNFYRAFFTGSTEYEYKTVYVENGSGNDATFFRRIVDVTASELRTVGGFSFVMPKPLDGYRPVGFRVVLKSDDRYHFSEFRLGTYSLSADSCVPDSSGASLDPSAGSGSGSSVPPSSSLPGSPDVTVPVPDYPTVDQNCVPKYFSGSFVSVTTSENLDPSSCAWRTVSGSFRCQDSGGHLCSVDADACLPEIADPSQYSSGSVEYTGDVTRYECSAGSVSCLWYSKKTCGPSASCYQDGDYCRVKPGEENPDYSSALGTVTYSGTPAADPSLDISNLGAFGTGRVSVSGVSHGVGSFSGVAPLTALTESGFCDMFNSDGSFAYYSDGEPFAVTLSVSGIIPIAWVENNIVPHVDRLIGSVTAPVNNLGAVFRTLGTFPEGSKICVLGRVAEVRYQSSLKSLDDEKHIVGFQYGRMGFFDYLFLLVFGVIALLFAKKSLSNL